MLKAPGESIDSVDPLGLSAQPEKVNPFPGPKSYQKDDTKFFFGRGEEIEELASLTLSTSAVLLFGPSGAGKSSLLEAGLVPYLEQRFKVGILPTVHLGKSALTDDGPGNRFVRTICDAIAKVKQTSLSASLDDIGALAASYRTSESQRILLILDQFEEIFNRPVPWMERVNFFKTLARTLKERPWLRAVVSLRSDYLAEIVPYERYLPDNFSVRYQIERLSEAQAAEAVEAAFAETRVILPPQDLQSLLDQLLEQSTADAKTAVRAPSVNTIQLQIVCRRLWEELRRRPGSISEPLFENDTKFTVQDSMARFVDEALQAAIADTGTDEATVRMWLRDCLITASGTRDLVLVEDYRTAGLPNSAVRSLVDAKLLQSERRHGSQLVELTHDSMVTAIHESNERWIRQHDLVRKRRALLLLLLLAAIILSLPLVRVPQLAEHISGNVSAGEVRISFHGAEGAAAIDVSANGPVNGKISAVVSRTDLNYEPPALERQLVTLETSSTEPEAIGAGSTAFAVPIEPMGSYVLTLATNNINILYQVSITGIPLLSGREELSNITTPRFAIALRAGQAAQLEVQGDLTSVNGAQVIASDFEQDWAVVRRPNAGLAVLNLESTVGPGTPGSLTRTDLPPPITIDLNEKRELPVGGAAIAQFVVAEPNSLLAAEAACSKPVDLTLIGDQTGRSARQQRGPTSTLLPLRLSSGPHELALSQPGSNTCTVSVREVNEQPITEIKPHVVQISPGEMSTAYALQFPKDVVVTTKQPAGVTASINCSATGTDEVMSDPDRLVAFLPAGSACTLWLVRSGTTESSQPSRQLLLPQLTGEGV